MRAASTTPQTANYGVSSSSYGGSSSSYGQTPVNMYGAPSTTPQTANYGVSSYGGASTTPQTGQPILKSSDTLDASQCVEVEIVSTGKTSYHCIMPDKTRKNLPRKMAGRRPILRCKERFTRVLHTLAAREQHITHFLKTLIDPC